jgi:mono/diheme cytochrome c family protein
MTILRIRPALILLVLAFLVSACSFSLAEDITPPPGSVQSPIPRTQPVQISGPLYPLVPPDVENGGAIYAEKCAPCHGDSGRGDGPRAAQLPNPVTALGVAQVARQAKPADWYTQVTQGNLERFMPPFASLSDRERWDVVAYAFSLSAPPAVLKQGAELFQANCAGCHGEQGAGDGPQAATLSTPPGDLMDQELMAQKSATELFEVISAGVTPQMPAFADQLSEDERWALAAYIRSLTLGTAPETETTAQEDTVQPTPQAAMPTTSDAADATPVGATPLAEAAPAMGGISGSVVNASGGEVPAGLEVTLRGFDEMRPVITQTTTLQSDGTYIFQEVDMPAGRAFLVTVDYQGTVYGSDIAIAQADLPLLDLLVTIFETTSDASILSADRLHLFLEFVGEDTLRVIQLYILSNPTNMTLVPPEEGQPTVRFSLPEGATNLEIQDGVLGGRFIETEDGFGDTVSIRPGAGSYELLYAFEMPYDRKLDLVQPMSVPVNAVVVLVPEDGIKVKGETLVDEGTRDVQGAQYRLFNGGSIPAGSELSLSISGRPSTTAPTLTAGSSTNLVIGLGIFGLTLILAGVFLYRRSRTAESEAEDESDRDITQDDTEYETESAETLMDAIIVLDDQYQAGQLPESAYLERRAKLKQRLSELMNGK